MHAHTIAQHTPFFFQRLNDHVQYLRKLQAAIERKEESNFCGIDSQNCRLGQWLYGTGPEEVQHLDAESRELFAKLFKPHEAFHLAGQRALQAQQAGDEEAVRQALGEMTQLSAVLVDLLIELDRRCEHL